MGKLPKKLKVVIYDLETIPDMTEVMKIFPSLSDYPGLTLKATITSILCAGWKELGKKKVHCINAWDFPGWKDSINNDKPVVEALYKILCTADVVITHNGKRFDWKFLETRLLKHGLPPLPKLIHIDTCAVSKGKLLSFNNRLNTLAKFLTEEKKMENGGWDLWVRCSNRDRKALATMARYCKQDVRTTEAIFMRLKPLIAQMPNMNIFSREKVRCPNCGSLAIQKRGRQVMKTAVLQRLQCMDCGTWSHSTIKGVIKNAG